jgi:hypothetical protein
MTRPSPSLLWMSIFVVVVAAICTTVAGSLAAAFISNPWFNGMILGVLAVGIAINVRQVLSLYPEIAWLDAWHTDDRLEQDAQQPQLLSSMALMLSGRGDMSLSATSMRTVLDSIRSRLEESRDLSRYFIGLLIFLGLLGTFWGLMATVGSVTTVIQDLSVEGTDGAAIFEGLKTNLKEPLSGMGVAFSSSLFGLAGSLVLGFLDLQAGHAQNRFFNELEELLSGSTRLSSGRLGEGAAIGGAPAYVEALLEKTADTLEKMQRANAPGEAQRERMAASLTELGHGLAQFNRVIEQQNDRFERIAQSQVDITRLLEHLAERDSGAVFSEDLRDELRLLTKTVANALAARDP